MVLYGVSLILFAATQSRTDWVEQSFDGGFKTSAPVVLQKAPQGIADPGVARADMWQASSGGIDYLVMTSDLKDPESITTAEAFTGIVTGLFKRPGVTIQGQRDLLLQGCPGLAMKGGRKGGKVASLHLFRSGDSIATFVAAYPAAESAPDVVVRFFASVKLPKKGTLTEPGPEMTRYPLGDSGISAMFPTKPEAHDIPLATINGEPQTLHGYVANYAFRAYIVGYIANAQKLDDAALKVAKGIMSDGFVKAHHGKLLGSKDLVVGSDKGFVCEFTDDHEQRSRIWVYLHGSKLVYVFLTTPAVFDNAKAGDSFLNSVIAN